MKFQNHRSGEYGLLLALTVFAVGWFLNFTGLFTLTDQAFEDVCQRITNAHSNNNRVLLVYTSPELLDSSNPEFIELLEFINQAVPAKIAILAEEGSVHSMDQLGSLPFADKITVGCPALEIQTLDSKIQVGFTDLQLENQPIYRKHIANLHQQGTTIRSFEKAIATSSSIAPQIPAGEFGINYSGGINSLPHVDAEEILAGKIISELLENKIILIGRRMNRAYGLATPVSHGTERMTRLELHAHILSTILRQDFRQNLGHLATAILLAFVSLVASQLFRQTSNSWILQALGGSLAFALLTSWIGYTWLSLHLPVSAMIVISVLAFSVASLRRFRVLHTAAEYWRLMLDLNQQELESDPQKAWDLLTDAVYQMFYPKRMVLMELKPNATHLNVVSTINCHADEIYEKRRDAQRLPYREAIDTEQPIRVERHCFFDEAPVLEESEFLVPLVLSSQVLGFMVIAMDRVALDKWKDFDNFLAQFANDMSIVVANNRAAVEKIQRQRIPIEQLKHLPEEKTLEKIRSQKLEQQNKVQRLNSAFERSESAMAICDVFGRILRANSRLIQLLQDVQVVTGETSCVEMVSKLTGRPIGDCRRVFQLAIMNNRANQICISPNEKRSYPCILFVKPLTCKTQESGGEIDYRRVVIEIIEGRAFEMINQWQNQLTENLCHSANEQVTQLHSQVQQLKNQKPGGKNYERNLGSIIDTISTVHSTLDRCQEIAQSHMTEDPQNCFPLVTVDIYRAAFQHYEQLFESREIELVHEFDHDGCIGVANPFLLEKVFLAILDLLSQNAFDHSQVFVSGQTIGGVTHFQFRNRGGGTPLQGLRKSLVNEDDSAANEVDDSEQPSFLGQEQMDRLSEIRNWLEAWEGTLRIANLADYSLNIELSLANESPLTGNTPSTPIQTKSLEL